MTCIIVNDASCLIDLCKGDLLAALCELPYRIVAPLPVRKSEVHNLSDSQWRVLSDAGMITHDLTPKEINKALLLKRHHPGLSAKDSFCFVVAQAYAGILLTGDALLRRVALADGLSVHGVLWIIDKLDSAGICPRSLLIQALKVWQEDITVFLPKPEISVRLERLSAADVGRKGWRQRKLCY